MTDAQRSWINECFAGSTVEAIQAALLEHSEAEARACAEEIGRISPTSLKLTFKAIREARESNNLAVALSREFRLAQACARGREMMEGIRAAVIEKDRNPKWSPARLKEVTAERIEARFNDPASETLELPQR